jgi:hypothetical protein
MTEILVGGVAQTKLAGTIDGFPWVLLWHFQNASGNDWTQSQIQALANAVGTQFSTNMLKNMATNVQFTNVACVDLGTTTPAQADSVEGAGPGGGTAGTFQPSSGCVLLNFNIASRYRGGHPRTYLPPWPSAELLTNNQWSGTVVTETEENFVTMIEGIVSAMSTAGLNGVTHCAVRYTWTYTDDPTHHKYLKTRGAPAVPYVVSSYTAQPRVCMQTRRLGPAAIV